MENESREATATRPDVTLRVGLLLTFGLGVFFRVFHFDVPGLWIDEYGTWWTVAGDGYLGVIERAIEIQGQSPLYYVLVRVATDLCGIAPWSLRLVSMLSGVALLWVGARVAHLLFGDPRVTLAVSLAFAVDTTLIDSSQDARPYSLALLFATISIWSYVKVLRGGGLIHGAILCFAIALTWYSHWLFATLVLVLIIHLLSTKPWVVGTGRRWIRLGIVTGALMAPGLWQCVTLFGRRESLNWISTTWRSFATDLLESVVHPGALGIALAAMVTLALARRTSLARLDHTARRLVLVWFFTPLLVLGLLPPLFGVSLLVTRYTSMVVPAFLVLTGALITLIRTGSWHDRLPMCAFAAAIFFGSLLPTYDRFGVFCPRPGSPWKEIAVSIETEHQRGDIILYATGFVELDAVAAGEASATIRAFAEFPLVAHLDIAADLPRSALPFGRHPDAIYNWERIVKSAFVAKRVWVVGGGIAVDYFVAKILPLPTVHVILDRKHGRYRTLLVQFR